MLMVSRHLIANKGRVSKIDNSKIKIKSAYVRLVLVSLFALTEVFYKFQ